MQEDDVLLKDSVLGKLETAIVNTKERKSQTREDRDKDVLIKLKKEKAELESLKIANSRLSEITKRIDYLKNLDNFESMMKELDHTAISKKGTEIINESLKENFLKEVSVELRKLGGEKIPLLVNSSTKDGRPIFQLRLEGANIPKGYKLDSILSEGEQKIASLAGLLAELNTAKHNNGIIFDDPVTSLDHQFRNKIAKRLVEEAIVRQIVLFTHDIAFLFDLQYFARKLNVPVHMQNIRKDGALSGIVYNSNTWHAQNVKDRLKTLKEEAESLKQKKQSLTKEKRNEKAGVLYGRLRETWERVVEEVLFDGVITRFGQEVQTQRLRKVYIDDEDYKCIFFNMKECAKFRPIEPPSFVSLNHPVSFH